VPLSTPALSSENSWYPPCADDIGNIIRMKCEDNLDLGISRFVDSSAIRVDRGLAEKVEEAVTKDRVVAKILVTSAKLFFSRTNKDSKSKINTKTLKRSMSNGSASSTGNSSSHGPVETNGSKTGARYDSWEVSVDIPEFETAGSIEVGSKGILICEKGIDQGGLRYFANDKLEVRCCQSVSFVLKVPLHSSSESAGRVAASKFVQWVGTEDGDLFDSLCGVLGGDMGEDSSSHGKTDTTAANGHMRSQSDGSMSSNSYDDHTHHQLESSNHSDKEGANGSTASTGPVHVLELVVSCRDRMIRDCLVLSLRAMTVWTPPPTPLTPEAKAQRGIDSLPWHHPNYPFHTDQRDAEEGDTVGLVDASGDGGGEVDAGLREEVSRLRVSLEQMTSSRDDLQRELDGALTAKESAEALAEKLQRELDSVRTGPADVDMEDLQEVCRNLHEKLHAAEATIVQMAAQGAGMVKNESFVSSSSTPEPMARLASAEDWFQQGVVFPVYEASSGEMVVPDTPDSKLGSPTTRGRGSAALTPDVSGDKAVDAGTNTSEVDRALIEFKHRLDDLRMAYGEEKGLGEEELAIARQRVADARELVAGMIHNSVFFLRALPDQHEWANGTHHESVSTSVSTLNGSGMHFAMQQKSRPEVDMFHSLVSISNELKSALNGTLPESSSSLECAEKSGVKDRSDSDEATGGTDSSDADDGTDAGGPSDSKLARMVETIRGQVAQVGKRLSEAKKGGEVGVRGDSPVDEEDDEEGLDGDEGFASVKLVTLDKEGVVPEDNEEEGLYTQGEMDHVSHELEQALQKCEALQKEVSELEEQKTVMHSSSDALIQDLKSQLSVLQSRSGEDRDRSGDEVQALRATIEEQDAALETFRTSYQKLQNMVTTFKEKYNGLCKETDGVKGELEETRTRVKQLEHDLKVSQHEKQMAAKDNEELRGHLASASEGAKSSQKMQADLDKLSLRLTDERQVAQAAKQNAAKEIRDLKSHNTDLSAALSKAKERIDALEGRLSLLQAETLSLSDARQQLTKQMTSYEAMRNQISQMRGQLIQADQEAQVSRTLLSEGSMDNEKLRKSVADMTAEIAALTKTLDKRTARVNDLKTRMDEMESEKKAIEKDRNSLRKENVRLRGSVNGLTEDRATLAKLQPLYNQQLELLATNHSRTSELETILGRANTAYRNSVIQLVNIELELGILSTRFARSMQLCDWQGMVSEDMCGLVVGLELRLAKSDDTIRSLNEDLSMARVAEPIAMKKLNYMVAKLSGEKNHYENKVRCCGCK
jgi:predicted nuclease with TOPRIM domain